MFTTYVIVTVLASTANIFSATCDFVRYKQVSIAMAKPGASESWMTLLGLLKAAGALGLLVGIDVPLIGPAAATGLMLFGCDEAGGTVVVFRNFRRAFQRRQQVGEPRVVFGIGGNPVGIVLAGLSACMTTTLVYNPQDSALISKASGANTRHASARLFGARSALDVELGMSGSFELDSCYLMAIRTV